MGDRFSDDPTGKAVYNLDRIALTGDKLDGRRKFCMFEHKIATNKSKVIASLKIENAGNGHPSIFAVTKEGKESGGIVGIGNISCGNAASVYPNPITNGETLTIETISGSSIRLITIQGATLIQLEATDNITKLPVNNLSQGIYLLTITNNTGKQTFKIIVK